ncbi:response regulator [Ancylothrix sp. C2]|uniref:hybrid sensor histidine kinase/response regulator n=1 Tax=Ancylothrix sp. D3o TaxID=2953691 RepID=UPI0021BB95BE|nr:response regulator [Ancylothrix sp. D3o]MCT7952355.1 response regulator [Ancylothrix sp. D3o]
MNAVRLLVLEDSGLDAAVIQATLREGGITFEWLKVQTRQDFLAALENQTFDVILSDYSLPGFDGISALKIAHNICPEVPFIFVSGTLGEELAIETLKSGATDYVLKHRLERLVPSVQRALQEVKERRSRAAAEAALKETEEQFRQLANAMPQIVWVALPNGEPEYLNQQWVEYTGFSLEETRHKGFLLKVTHPDDFEQTNFLWEECLKSGDFYQTEFRLKRVSDGEYRWFLCRAVPVKNKQGEIIHWYGTLTDIDKQKQVEETLRRRTEELDRANRIKDEFLAVLSHELRTPLGPILGWAQLLRMKKPDEQTLIRGLETIERNANIQTQLIEDLLDVSRILRGKISLNVRLLDLRLIITAALETVQLAAEAKSIEIETQMPENVGQVRGDAGRLQQVMWNLLSNAVKFTPSGGRVQIFLQEVEDWVEVKIKDTGKGIEPAFFPYMFDYFRQADSSTTRKFGGLGVGLGIVRHLVELHGGVVEAESAGEGMGATFTVKLPVFNENKTSRLKPISQQRFGETADSWVREHLPPISPLAGIRVLVVDDETDTLELITWMLKDAGAIAAGVTSAQSAIEVWEGFQPDVLISDIGMPEEDGYSLIARVRTRMSADKVIPAIALTAYAREEDRQRAFSAGFQEHITKPVESLSLIAAVAVLTEVKLLE